MAKQVAFVVEEIGTLRTFKKLAKVNEYIEGLVADSKSIQKGGITESTVRGVIRAMISDTLETVDKSITQELIAQGHNNTGALIGSITRRIKSLDDGMVGEISMNDYYNFVNDRTPGSRIPFSGSRGKGGKSLYIQALIKFFKQKGAENPISAAFATAHKQKKEGRPTRGSFLHSSNGRRTGFQEASLKAIEDEVYSQMGGDIEKIMELSIL